MQVEEVIDHMKQGYPVSLATGKKETPAMKLLGLHECHCYPALDWMASDPAYPEESDYLTIRNPHNRISIKATVPNLGVELEQEHAFSFGRAGGWAATHRAFSSARGGKGLDEATLRTLFEEIDEDHSGQINGDELGSALRARGFKISTAVIHKLLKFADADGDGMLDVDEFASVMKRGSLVQ